MHLQPCYIVQKQSFQVYLSSIVHNDVWCFDTSLMCISIHSVDKAIITCLYIYIILH